MSRTETLEARNGVQVIARAAAVLRALKGTEGGMSLGQIAEQVGLPRSTIQRIVGALVSERLVVAPSGGGRIRLGPELHALAEAARYNVADLVRPLLQALSRETEETVDLSVLRGNELVFIDQIPGTQRLRAVSSVGEHFPLTTTANGKACLALLADEIVLAHAQVEAANPRRLAGFMTEIVDIRRSGYAVDRDEHTAGISAVGVAFRDWKGDIYAVSIPAPSSRFGDNKAVLTSAILRLRRDIENLIAA